LKDSVARSRDSRASVKCLRSRSASALGLSPN